MKDDRGRDGQDVTESGGYIRPRQVNDHRFGSAPLDGGADGAPVSDGAPGVDGAPGADRPMGVGLPGDPGLTTENGQSGAADSTGVPGESGTVGAPQTQPPTATGQRREGRPRKAKHRGGRSWWIELPVLLVFALVLALVIKTFVVQAFFIPSSSMENTLEIGDKVLVNKLVYDFRSIHRGDIVVFNGDGSWDAVPVRPKPPLTRLWDAISGLFGTPPGAHDYIKRVIGIPGDHVVCCDRQTRITVNGVPLNEKSYLYPGNAPSATPFNITVPPGRLWVMGDHRAVSEDSRGHMSSPGNGTVPEDHVVGRAFWIIAPISRWRILPIPATFQQQRLAAAGAAVLAAIPAAPLALGFAAAPAAPLAVGLTAAIPLTWLQRRVRRRLGALLRRGGRLGGGTRLRRATRNGPRPRGRGLRGPELRQPGRRGLVRRGPEARRPGLRGPGLRG